MKLNCVWDITIISCKEIQTAALGHFHTLHRWPLFDDILHITKMLLMGVDMMFSDIKPFCDTFWWVLYVVEIHLQNWVVYNVEQEFKQVNSLLPIFMCMSTWSSVYYGGGEILLIADAALIKQEKVHVYVELMKRSPNNTQKLFILCLLWCHYLIITWHIFYDWGRHMEYFTFCDEAMTTFTIKSIVFQININGNIFK